jgi:hypothetical protein
MMVIHLGPDLEAALTDLARQQGIAPEVLALYALRERFLGQPKARPLPEVHARMSFTTLP